MTRRAPRPVSVVAALGLGVGVLTGTLAGTSSATAAEADCHADPRGPVACENAKPGAPASEWDISGSGDSTIQGFATDMSVDRGGRVDFKVDTDAAAYTVTIYRLGWYGGLGARRVADVVPSATLPQSQPPCVDDALTGNYDCGTWGVSASWDVPASAVSGVHVARLARGDTGGSSHIPFVVRDDAGGSEIVMQTSDTTWQAYNDYGGMNLYDGPRGRAVKVSYNRPFSTRGVVEGRDFLFSAEYPMIRFLERNGYDVSYISGIDTDRFGSLLRTHETFVSVGHDEYWSGTQRANVEAAREAGVNLAFFSGNEVYWKTRWEPSIDGRATDRRTLVTYKETRDNAKTDPSPEWTGTWRDPRFSPPSDGGRPENALTGTAYMSNFTDLPVTVSADEGRLRFWRHTPLASQPAGTSTALAPHTVGYESNEDLDNGFRPAGLIRVSTTTGPTPEYLRDYGSTVTPGTTTHNATLYRAPSGALVFGAGTIQWSWGLDDQHDGTTAPPDPRMQQATLNLFSDMGAQPATRMPGLVTPSPSTDRTPPVTTVTSPAAGSALASGSTVTVSGTASDAAGVVAGVEVSLDGGSTWRRAQGTTSWTYRGVMTGTGSRPVLARASDDSANVRPGGTRVDVTVSCPCSVYGDAEPGVAPQTDTTPVELGVRVVPQRDGWIQGVRFYKGPRNGGTHTGTLWSADGTALATGTFSGETAGGWQILRFAAPVRVSAGTAYIASYFAPQGGYHAQNHAFTRASAGTDPLVAPASAAGAPNGVYSVGAGFPTQSFRDTSYFVDALFTDVDTQPPAVTGRTPDAGASSVATSSAVTATFSELVDTASIAASLTRDSTAVDVAVTTATVDGVTRVTLTPRAPMTPGAVHTVAVRASDVRGNAMTEPATWTFRTARAPAPAGTCPCSLFGDDAPTGAQTVSDRVPVELGVRFTPSRDGWVEGVRFYKAPGTTGSHVATLWRDGDRQQLARATFSAESSSGWQEVRFATRVPVTKGTPYVVSYLSPTGTYTYAWNGFGPTGLSRPPLSTGEFAGVYTYTPGGFPGTSTSTNYFADVLFDAPPLDTAAPAVSARTPGAGGTGVGTDAVVRVTFAAPVQAASTQVGLVDQSTGTAVAGTATYTEATRTLTFAPRAPLALGRTYQARVEGARSEGGTAMTPSTWTFSTVTAESCPCTLFGSREPAVAVGDDGSAIELGTRFVPAADGRVSAVRFHRSPGVAGGQVANIWSDDGRLLASATVAEPTASGWQTAVLGTPLAVTAGTTYVASYLAPQGGYSATVEFFGSTPPWARGPLAAAAGPNGVYRMGGGFPDSTYRSTHYFVDVVFAPTAGTPTPTPTPTSMPTPTATPTPTNLARGKAATQSSTSNGGVASRAVDGTTNGIYSAGSVTHTASTAQPWWQVDLGAASTLSSIRLSNRIDCCSTRLANFYVFVSGTDMTGRTLDQLRLDPAVATRQVHTLNGASSLTLPVSAQGRYVRVQLAGTTSLSLAEVEVTGVAGAPATPVSTERARGRSATQVSTSSGGVAARAVDGSADGTFAAGSVTATGSQAQPWWQVDLAQAGLIDEVRLSNRTDCCQTRLANFYVFVSGTDMTGRTLAQLRADPAVAQRHVVSLDGAAGIRLSLAGAQGRYVRVQLAGTNVLSLAEVEVRARSTS